MIAWLSGDVVSRKPGSVVIQTGGVGYLVHISLPTFYTLPEQGQKVSLHIYTHVREDVLQLFGFPSQAEQEIFQKLIGVSKVGPKLAINVLSGLPAAELAETVRHKDTARLSSIPGVGAKTADRIILELFDKLKDFDAGEEISPRAPSSLENDAVEALLSLGYKAREAQKAVKAAMALKQEGGLEELIRNALGQVS
ncbi:MAG: Holliday junction branch migration protein RuvA [Nitrospinota bacterium]|nr:Holliday junction branch migration protein RuvA [Nitrospinota bacterium]